MVQYGVQICMSYGVGVVLSQLLIHTKRCIAYLVDNVTGKETNSLHLKNQLKDSRGTSVRLLGIANEVLTDLKVNKHVKVAWVSCTDEPSWAAECLNKFKLYTGSLMCMS